LEFAGVPPETCWKLTASCKVSSAKGYWTRRFGAAERCTFSVFLIAIKEQIQELLANKRN
jgi:hypothetical protein